MTATDGIAFFFAQQGYLIANQDSGATSYTGFENKVGEWYILKAVTTGAAVVYTYAKGAANYAASYANRVNETYGIPSVTFK